MTINSFFTKALNSTKDHSPLILTAVSIVGLSATTYLTVRATHRAVVERDTLWNELGREPTNKEWVAEAWQFYIPPTTTFLATIASIVGVQTIHVKRQTALLGAYTVVDQSLREYRNKVVEKVGEKKEKEYRDELAEENFKKSEPVDGGLAPTNKVLCRDAFSGRDFYTDVETIRRAANDINELCLNHGYASLNDFYSRLDLVPTNSGEMVGWSSDNMLKLSLSTILTEKGHPCVYLDFVENPKINYYKVW